MPGLSDPTVSALTSQFRNATAAEWAAEGPILQDGEPGYENDTGILRVGDGRTIFTALPVVGNVGGAQGGAFSNLFQSMTAFTITPSVPANTVTTSKPDPYSFRVEHTSPANANNNDRRFYAMGPAMNLAAVEVRARVKVRTTGTITPSQVGLGARFVDEGGGSGEAHIFWTNVFFETAQGLTGVWEWDGATAGTNQFGATSSYPSYGLITLAVLQNNLVTVTLDRPHGLTIGQSYLIGVLGVNGTIDDASLPKLVISPTQFTYPKVAAGTFGITGHAYPLSVPDRMMAMRLNGTTMRTKQWLPSMVEPAWDQAPWAQTNTTPATLLGSGVAPAATGNVGFVAAHLGPGSAANLGGFVEVSDWTVIPL